MSELQQAEQAAGAILDEAGADARLGPTEEQRYRTVLAVLQRRLIHHRYGH